MENKDFITEQLKRLINTYYDILYMCWRRCMNYNKYVICTHNFYGDMYQLKEKFFIVTVVFVL